MKNIFILFLLMLILISCSTEGDIKIFNRTTHNLYFTIKGHDYILEGAETSDTHKTISVDTGNQFLFFGNDLVEVDMHLEGETFMMQDAINGIPIEEYFAETTLQIEPKKTLNIYCSPTHAGVKLINNSSVDVVELAYYTDDPDSLISLIDHPVIPGDTVWSRLRASSAGDSISYSFIIEFENGTVDDSSYVNINDLITDEQHRIELE